jgi:hypothetical protein
LPSTKKAKKLGQKLNKLASLAILAGGEERGWWLKVSVLKFCKVLKPPNSKLFKESKTLCFSISHLSKGVPKLFKEPKS